MLDRLAAALARRQRFTQARPRRAAILLPLVGPSSDVSLLLTRRAAALSSHSGQVAFPGGVVDPADDGPVGTALREAQEEVGLERSDVTDVLGLLDDLPSFKNDMVVTPVVARIAPHLSEAAHFCANEDEVARIFCIPLSELLRAERWRHKQVDWRGKSLKQYYFDYDGETLWGLSAYATLMLTSLAAPGSDAPTLSWFEPEGRAGRPEGEAGGLR